MSIDLALSLFVQYGYWIVFAAILLDNAGLPIPGELLLLLFGALARYGHLDAGLGLVVASAAAMSGDSIGYWLGRLTGDRALRTYCRVTLGSGMCVPKALAYYHRYGNATVIVGRFVMGVRAFLSPLAGSAGMPFGRFLLFDSIGALLWSGFFIFLGYSVGGRLEWLHEGYRAGSLVLVGALGVGFGAYLLLKLVRREGHGPAFLGEPMVSHALAAFRRRQRPAVSLISPAVEALAGDETAHRAVKPRSRQSSTTPST